MTNPLTTTPPRAMTTATLTPATDVTEHDDRIVLQLDLPGVPKDAIDVTIENRTLSIRGERAENSGDPIHREFGAVRFERSFALPATLDGSRIAARAEHGVLELTIPRLESARSRRIEIP